MTKKIKRQLKNAKKEATEEELESLARNPEEAQKVMQSYITGQRAAHAKVVNTVEDIQNKHLEILKLERSVEDLYQLF